jgi:hypothetical protein
MSLIWNILLEGDTGLLLFEKLSPTEAKCNACSPPKTIQLGGRSPTNLKHHIRLKHPPYLIKLKEIEENQEKKEMAEKNSMEKFIKVLPKGKYVLIVV